MTYIRGAKGTYKRPVLLLQMPAMYKEQAAFSGSKKKISVTFATTKAGKTVGLGSWALEYLWLHGGKGLDGYWYAPTQRVAKQTMLRVVKWLTEADPDGTIWRQHKTEAYVEIIPNGGRLYFRGMEKPDLNYGPDALFCVLDEGTRCREEALAVMLSVTTAMAKLGHGWIRIIGNMKTRGHWMYRLWESGTDGGGCKGIPKGTNPDVESFRVTYREAIVAEVIDPETVEMRRRTMAPDAFNALFEVEPTDDGTNPFGLVAIAACAGQGSINDTVAIGVDLARKVDYTVAIGLDEFGCCTMYERWQKKSWPVTTQILANLIGDLPAMVDSSGVGDSPVQSLQAVLPNVIGYVFTELSRQQLLDNLAIAIQAGEVHGLDPWVINELEMFEIVPTLRGVRYQTGGATDDTVMALALAVMRLGRARKYDMIPVTVPMGPDWSSPYAEIADTGTGDEPYFDSPYQDDLSYGS